MARVRAVDRLHLRRLLHADPRRCGAELRAVASGRGKRSGSSSTASPPTATPATCASRCASTCARTRASRARCSTATRWSSPTTPSAASRAARASAARDPRAQGWATASTARCASRSARPASTSARACRYECIGCAACIDACDGVMDKMGSPRGLIRYTTQNALDHEPHAHAAAARARIYGVLAGGADGRLRASAVPLRNPVALDVIRDRKSLYRLHDDGHVDNVYTVRILNKTEHAQRFALTAHGASALTLLPATRIPCAERRGVFAAAPRAARGLRSARRRNDRVRVAVARRFEDPHRPPGRVSSRPRDDHEHRDRRSPPDQSGVLAHVAAAAVPRSSRALQHSFIALRAVIARCPRPITGKASASTRILRVRARRRRSESRSNSIRATGNAAAIVRNVPRRSAGAESAADARCRRGLDRRLRLMRVAAERISRRLRPARRGRLARRTRRRLSAVGHGAYVPRAATLESLALRARDPEGKA